MFKMRVTGFFFTRASQNIKKSVFITIKFIFNGKTLNFHYEFNGVESVACADLAVISFIKN